MDVCDARHSFQDYLIHHDRFAQIPNHPLLGRHLTQAVVIFGLPHPPSAPFGWDKPRGTAWGLQIPLFLAHCSFTGEIRGSASRLRLRFPHPATISLSREIYSILLACFARNDKLGMF